MTDKLTLPKAKFTHELSAAPVDPTMKQAEAKSAKLYLVPVDKIKPIPGFNVRVESPDYIAHREAIKHDIAINGYNPTKPLAGYVAHEEGEGNVIYVTDGHTRLAAVNDFNSDPDVAEADEITHIPVLVQPKEVSLTDLTVQLHTANNGRPLTPYELGVVVKRLLAEEGAKKGEIASRLGVTTRYLDDVLLLANANGKVKQHVAAGDVSSTMAIQLLRKNADTAAEKIEAAVAKAASTGKKATKKLTGPKMQKVRATVSFKAGDDMKEIVKSAASAIREAVQAETGEEDVKLSLVDGSVSLVIEVPAPEKPEGEKAVERRQKAAKGGAAKSAKGKKASKSEAAPKGKKAAKVEADEEPKKKRGKKAPSDDLGIPGAEPADDDGEPAILPPKVLSDEGDEEVDI